VRVTRLGDRIAALSPEKRALLERRLFEAKRAPLDRISRREAGRGAIPLSFAQQRLWFLEQLEPGRAFYNLPLVTRLSGRISPEVLEGCLNQIATRHEALRTTFAMVDGTPAQVIQDAARVMLTRTDLTELPEAGRDAEVQRLVAIEAHRPFDLTRDVLLRASLLALGETDHVLLLTMHHIASDGWSIGVLQRELAALYAAGCAGQPAPLAELPVQYADFAIWQRRRLSGPTLEHLLDHWARALAGAPALLELPTDRPRPRVQAFQGASYAVPYGRPLIDRLKAVARRHDTTLFVTLLAGFAALLQRYSGQTDFTIGTPIANRTRSELEPLIGFFVNTLVLRVDLSGAPTFGDAIARLRAVTLDAFAHQDAPFELLVERLQPARNLGHNPLFQVMLVLQNTQEIDQVGHAPAGPVLHAGTSKFDLTLSATETADGMVAVFEYDTRLFDHATIAGFAENLQVLLDRAGARPEQALHELLRIDGDARAAVLTASRGPEAARPFADTVHGLVERQAIERPGAIAVIHPGGSVGYRELDRRANRVANRLRAAGVEAGTLVGLCVERSLDFVLGVLGILKAGGAYVPLDPAHPTARLALMLGDTAAPVVLVSPALAGGLPPTAAQIVRLDDPLIAGEDERPPPPVASPDALAYVIYTSGSTGRPKGVMVQHRGVCSLAEAFFETLGLGEGERVLQFSSPNFDVSMLDLLVVFRAGATLFVAAQDALLPGPPLVELLGRERINMITIPPSALSVLPPAALPDLHTLVVGGEALSAELVARWAPGRRMFNAYGPTETSICVTIGPCAARPITPALGATIAGTCVYVLDEHLEPVPFGVPGELYLGGAAARGYLNQPALTAERFVPDPFAARPGERMFRTGDRARRLADGSLLFLGRIDDQVKIRGYRIELGEIEAALRAHPAVRDVAVLAVDGAAGFPRLVAWYVAAEASPAVAELQRHLRDRLPEHMVPALFVAIPALPITPNGKLDRQALTRLVPTAAADTAAPTTATEEAIARIWREVLEREQLSIHDSFFDLGGHSLLATRVVARIGEALGVELPLRRLFELPTVAQLAGALDALRSERGAPQEPALARVARRLVTLEVEPSP
jgi:amino acid adenylation domain-containing protein